MRQPIVAHQARHTDGRADFRAAVPFLKLLVRIESVSLLSACAIAQGAAIFGLQPALARVDGSLECRDYFVEAVSN
jgi:hypothetical protein